MPQICYPPPKTAQGSVDEPARNELDHRRVYKHEAAGLRGPFVCIPKNDLQIGEKIAYDSSPWPFIQRGAFHSPHPFFGLLLQSQGNSNRANDNGRRADLWMLAPLLWMLISGANCGCCHNFRPQVNMALPNMFEGFQILSKTDCYRYVTILNEHSNR